MTIEIKKIFPSQEHFLQLKADFCSIADAFRAPAIDNEKQIGLLIKTLIAVAFKNKDLLAYLHDLAMQNTPKNTESSEQSAQSALVEDLPAQPADQVSDPHPVCEGCVTPNAAPCSNQNDEDSPPTA